MSEVTISDDERAAATEVFDRYEIWLGGENHGNQDRWSCIETIALIIHKHTGGTPQWLSQALNEGDGVYRP